jgi:hypothetical protein
MRKMTAAAAVVVAISAGAVVLAVAERDAGAQRVPVVAASPKALQVAGTDQTNQHIDTTAGAIVNVTVRAHTGGGYSVYVQGIAGRCTMSFSTAADAGEMAARVLDAKTTTVVCQGPVNTQGGGFIPLHQIDNATDLAIVSGP